MSALGWDGFSLSADRACFRGGVVMPVDKIVYNDNYAAGFVGRFGPGKAMAQWAIDGAVPATFRHDEWKDNEIILVSRKTGEAWTYDGHDTPIPLTCPTAIGETAACAALLALMLAGVPVQRGIQLLVESGRYDAVGFGVQTVSVRSREPVAETTADPSAPGTPVAKEVEAAVVASSVRTAKRAKRR